MQITQRDSTFYLAFKYDASEAMTLSVYWGLDAAALSSSIEQWNLKYAAAAAAKVVPSTIMGCLPMFSRSYNQMQDDHIVEVSPARSSLSDGAPATSSGTHRLYSVFSEPLLAAFASFQVA